MTLASAYKLFGRLALALDLFHIQQKNLNVDNNLLPASTTKVPWLADVPNTGCLTVAEASTLAKK